jgi:hypothetical protein
MSMKDNMKIKKVEVKPRRSWGNMNPSTKVMRDRRKRRDNRSAQKSKLRKGEY